MTRVEAASRVGCSTWSIDRLVENGGLKVVRIGVGQRRRHLRILKTSLERLIGGDSTMVDRRTAK